MDRRRIELQIRAILVTYRIERRRRDSPTMEGFRERARSILLSLEEEVAPHSDLQAALDDARRELDRGDGDDGTTASGSERVVSESAP